MISYKDCLCVNYIVNNVGMKYSEKFAYFLEIPNAEQVRFAFRKKRLQDSFHFDSDFYSHTSTCLFQPENHTDRQLQHAVCPSGKRTVKSELYLLYNGVCL